MDNRKILLTKLDWGRSKEITNYKCFLLLIKIRIAIFSRSNIPREERMLFHLYIDEFQNFATKEFIDALSREKKCGLSPIMVHQNLSQLLKELQDSIFTNYRF